MLGTYHKAHRLLRRAIGPAARRLGVITHVSTRTDALALTFDDGPHPYWTPRLLDLLASHQARATFFVTGAMAERHPAIVGRALSEGHAIGDHTWSHASLPSASREERQRQLEWSAEQPWRHDRLFRPPFGDLDLSSRRALGRRGLRVIGWNVSVLDWQPRSSGEMLDVLQRRARPGAIVLLHDHLFMFAAGDQPDREPLLQALDQFLWGCACHCVTVPELLTLGRPQFALAFKRSDASWLRGLESFEGLGFSHR